MTADVINLRKARKARARSDAQARASANRVLFGRTKAERKAAELEKDRASRAIEGHRLDGPSPGDGGDER